MSHDSQDELTFRLDSTSAGLRLDAALASRLPQFSRSFLTRLIKDGAILLNGQSAKPSAKIKGGEHVEIELPEPEVIEAKPETIPLSVLLEDEDIIAVNKPAGMVAHPSSGHTSGTLVNALLWHCKDLAGINGALRPGIVHRLDRETSGVIVAAKNDQAAQGLMEQFAARTVRKQYLAIAHGMPSTNAFVCGGRIGRHPTRRTEMTVMRGETEGREALTEFEILERFDHTALASKPGTSGSHPGFLALAKPRTGRTHQIRVHLAKSGFPIICDGMYGREEQLPGLGLERHALHAWKLEFDHPRTGKRVHLEAPIADDIRKALHLLGSAWLGRM